MPVLAPAWFRLGVPGCNSPDGLLDFVLFRLPVPTLSLNVWHALHYREKVKHKRRLAALIRDATASRRPAEPFRRALVQIERRSVGTLDHDNAVGGAKPLLDVLRAPGEARWQGKNERRRLVVPNPTGLAIVLDDSPNCLISEIRCQRVGKRAEQCSIICVCELP